MKEIIKITENNGKKAVNARDLYNFLEVETPFHKWMPRMLEYGFDENIDWTKMSSENQSFNIDYVLTLDCAKEISMLQRTDRGKEARKYFIECEKQLKQSPAIPQSFAEALQLAADQAKQLELQAPKVNYYDNVLQSETLLTTNEIAKDLGMSAITLNKKLHEAKIQYKQSGTWLLYSKHQDKGYAKTKTHTYQDKQGNTQTSIHTYWTEKGREFIINYLNK